MRSLCACPYQRVNAPRLHPAKVAPLEEELHAPHHRLGAMIVTRGVLSPPLHAFRQNKQADPPRQGLPGKKVKQDKGFADTQSNANR